MKLSNKFFMLKSDASMDSQSLCLSQFKTLKVKKIRLGFIEFLDSSRPRNKVLILFRNDWECYQIFKLYFKFLVHSWFGKYENEIGSRSLDY